MNASLTNLAILLALALLIIFSPVYLQYRKHKAPLKAVDPSIKYGFFHHIGIVTIPIIRYRVRAKLQRRHSSATPK